MIYDLFLLLGACTLVRPTSVLLLILLLLLVTISDKIPRQLV